MPRRDIDFARITAPEPIGGPNEAEFSRDSLR